jgi:hypothetical protein
LQILQTGFSKQSPATHRQLRNFGHCGSLRPEINGRWLRQSWWQCLPRGNRTSRVRVEPTGLTRWAAQRLLVHLKR